MIKPLVNFSALRSKPSVVRTPNFRLQQRRVVTAKNLATGQLKQVLERKSEMIARQIDRQKLRQRLEKD